jgi:beta-glucosidase
VIFGAATAAYQIEGAWDEDGKGPSIWDTFVRLPGRIREGDTGDVACDHYHRYEEDVALMAELGLQAYRFSVSWARVLPEGVGRVNAPGLDFYDRLVDALLARGIQPWLTLHHWDLPQALYDRGGWESGEMPGWFAEYATVVAERLGDRVHHWMTLNEPQVIAYHGYLSGEHAPGRKEPRTFVRVADATMQAHAAGMEALRAVLPDAQLGIALNTSPVEPLTGSEEDVTAARRVDGSLNRWFFDAVFGRGYPEDLREWYAFDGPAPAPPEPDFVGLNYYFRQIVRAASGNYLGAVEQPPEGVPKTDMGWEIHAQGLADALGRMREEYEPRFLAVTENGMAVQGIEDEARVEYLRDHIAAADGLADAYFVWSLLDNFEWARGFGMRFGLIHVDYQTQQRTVKRSGRWYADRIAQETARAPAP